MPVNTGPVLTELATEERLEETTVAELDERLDDTTTAELDDLLDELGFGLDLGSCAATGSNDKLIYVSPKSGRAVSESAGAEYRDRLLRLPSFLCKGRQGAPTIDDFWSNIRNGVDATKAPGIDKV